MARLAPLLVCLTLLVASSAVAQDVPAAPPEQAGDTESHGAAGELAVPAPPATGQPPPGPLPPATAAGQVPMGTVLEPLVSAAEADLAAQRTSLALARASVAMDALAEGEPLRVRSEGLVLLARQRLEGEAETPPLEDVLSPLVAQAELDVRSGNTALAVPRLDFALARLPAGSPLRQRAERLRALSSQAPGPPTYTGAQPSGYGYGTPPTQPIYAPQQVYRPPPRPPRDPNRRGTGEAIELYITAGLFGALTGAYLPYVASDATAAGSVYALTMIGGAGLFVVGALALDLGLDPVSGVEPTIASSIRFGIANGFFAFLLYDDLSFPSTDGNVSFTLPWIGGAAGAALGLAIGFGLEPEVREERFVESAGVWGVGLTGAIAMALGGERDSQTYAGALGLAGLNAGWLIGALVTAGGGHQSIGRTLFMDMGFLGGFGIGMAIPAIGYIVTQSVPDEEALGVGAAIGAVAGWSAMLAVTEGWSEEGGSRQAREPQVSVSASPVEGGAMVSANGAF